MRRVKRFGVYQTSKVAAIIMFFVALLFVIPFGLMSSLFAHTTGKPFFLGGFFLFIMPFLYGVMGFIMTAVSCAIYNLVSKWTGGIELELELVDDDPDTAGLK